MLDSIVKYVISELAVIAQAPMSFALSLAVLVAVVWRALAWRYSGTIDSLEGRNKLQADQISDYKIKLSGASPDEAKSRLDALEIQIKALSPRRLTENQKETILSALGSVRGIIDIVHDMGSADAKALTGDFAMTFQKAGWGVSLPAVLGLGNPPPTGVALQVKDPHTLTTIETKVRRALELADITFDIQTGLRSISPPPSNPPGFPSIPREANPDVGLLISTKLQ